MSAVVETEVTVGAVVSVVVVVLSVLFEPSLLLLQDMEMKLKRNRERMMSRCFTKSPIGGSG